MNIRLNQLSKIKQQQIKMAKIQSRININPNDIHGSEEIGMVVKCSSGYYFTGRRRQHRINDLNPIGEILMRFNQ
ncbi:hypothetical protein SS50377_26005 [Spironucleus salmonicida]|uniref:Uncharacterized protein n=1 Tax=Spironucleus salmonicida TaxID=348837 RepID=A0A9P8LPH4_9EUKA|nr:hypothetical protein SS50377_26005 [Spironucleus salmonicida]